MTKEATKMNSFDSKKAPGAKLVTSKEMRAAEALRDVLQQPADLVGIQKSVKLGRKVVSDQEEPVQEKLVQEELRVSTDTLGAAGMADVLLAQATVPAGPAAPASVTSAEVTTVVAPTQVDASVGLLAGGFSPVALAVAGAGLALAGGGGGGGTPAPVVSKTFVVTETGSTVTFSGTATGDITVAVNAITGVATFTREGVAASTTVTTLSNNTINLASGQTLVLTGAQADALSVEGVAFTGTGNVKINANDSGVGVVTSLTLAVDVDITGDLTFDMTNDTDSITLAAGSSVNLHGGNLIVSDGMVMGIDPTVTFANIGSITLNSGLTLTFAQFQALAGQMTTAGAGVLTVQVADQAEAEAFLLYLVQHPGVYSATPPEVLMDILDDDSDVISLAQDPSAAYNWLLDQIKTAVEELQGTDWSTADYQDIATLSAQLAALEDVVGTVVTDGSADTVGEILALLRDDLDQAIQDAADNLQAAVDDLQGTDWSTADYQDIATLSATLKALEDLVGTVASVGTAETVGAILADLNARLEALEAQPLDWSDDPLILRADEIFGTAYDSDSVLVGILGTTGVSSDAFCTELSLDDAFVYLSEMDSDGQFVVPAGFDLLSISELFSLINADIAGTPAGEAAFQAALLHTGETFDSNTGTVIDFSGEALPASPAPMLQYLLATEASVRQVIEFSSDGSLTDEEFAAIWAGITPESTTLVFDDAFIAQFDGYDTSTVEMQVTTALTVGQATALAEAGFNLTDNVTYAIDDYFTNIQAAHNNPNQFNLIEGATNGEDGETSLSMDAIEDFAITARGNELDNVMDFGDFGSDLPLLILAGAGNDTISAGKGDDVIVGDEGADRIALTTLDSSNDTVVYSSAEDGASYTVATISGYTDSDADYREGGYLQAYINDTWVSYTITSGDVNVSGGDIETSVLQHFADAIMSDSALDIGEDQISIEGGQIRIHTSGFGADAADEWLEVSDARFDVGTRYTVTYSSNDADYYQDDHGDNFIQLAFTSSSYDSFSDEIVFTQAMIAGPGTSADADAVLDLSSPVAPEIMGFSFQSDGYDVGDVVTLSFTNNLGAGSSDTYTYSVEVAEGDTTDTLGAAFQALISADAVSAGWTVSYSASSDILTIFEDISSGEDYFSAVSADVVNAAQEGTYDDELTVAALRTQINTALGANYIVGGTGTSVSIAAKGWYSHLDDYSIDGYNITNSSHDVVTGEDTAGSDELLAVEGLKSYTVISFASDDASYIEGATVKLTFAGASTDPLDTFDDIEFTYTVTSEDMSNVGSIADNVLVHVKDAINADARLDGITATYSSSTDAITLKYDTDGSDTDLVNMVSGDATGISSTGLAEAFETDLVWSASSAKYASGNSMQLNFTLGSTAYEYDYTVGSTDTAGTSVQNFVDLLMTDTSATDEFVDLGLTVSLDADGHTMHLTGTSDGEAFTIDSATGIYTGSSGDVYVNLSVNESLVNPGVVEVSSTAGISGPVAGRDAVLALAAVGQETTIDFGSVDAFEGAVIGVTIGSEEYWADLLFNASGEVDWSATGAALVAEINGASGEAVEASWSDDTLTLTGDISVSTDVSVADTAISFDAEGFSTNLTEYLSSAVTVEDGIHQYSENDQYVLNGFSDSDNLSILETGHGTAHDVVTGFQTERDFIAFDGLLSASMGNRSDADYENIYSGSGDVELNLTGLVIVDRYTNRGASDISSADVDTSVNSTEMTSADDVAALLNELYDFSSGIDGVLNTTAFSITSTNLPSKAALWVHTESYDGDDTVDASELSLLATIQLSSVRDYLGSDDFIWTDLFPTTLAYVTPT